MCIFFILELYLGFFKDNYKVKIIIGLLMIDFLCLARNVMENTLKLSFNKRLGVRFYFSVKNKANLTLGK